MNTLPLLPDKLPHTFSNIAWEIIPEISYDDVVYLSILIKESNREPIYEPLKDALRKGLHAKLAGVEACLIDEICIKDYDPSSIYQDPVGQIKHAKSIIEFIYHLKSALDSIAVFLNEYHNLGFKGGDRDFRKTIFTSKIIELDIVIGEFINTEFEWINISSKSTNSLLATRDEWIHRKPPNVVLVQPPGALGMFPVPLLLVTSLENISSTSHRSTEKFYRFHWDRFVRLYSLLMSSCIAEEMKLLRNIPPRERLSKSKISLVKTALHKQILVEKITIGSFTRDILSKYQ